MSNLLETAIDIEVRDRLLKVMGSDMQKYRIRVFDGDWNDTYVEDPLIWKGYLNHVPQVGDILHIRDCHNVKVIRRQVFVDGTPEIDLFTEEA